MTEPIPTSLGPSLAHRGPLWSLDLSGLQIIRGLSVLSGALGDKIIDQAFSERMDINVEHVIRPRDNPELVNDLGITHVKVVAEHTTIAAVVRDAELFQDHLRAVFGTLQRDRYRLALFPATPDATPQALLFTFTFPPAHGDAKETLPFIFLLERLTSPRTEDRCSLRISIEDPRRPRLAISSIPHVVVDDIESRSFIAGSTRIAETWAEGLRREAERNRRAFTERYTPHSHLFNRFRKAGLQIIQQVNLTWHDAFVDRILESDPADLCFLLKRVLLALEDRAIRDLLSHGHLLQIVCDDVPVYLDLSQIGRVLSISLGSKRKRLDLDAFLDRMPSTLAVVNQAPPDALADVRVFLIHHITAEVLGLIAALRRLGCRDLTTLFVAYAGEAPSSYLGPLLDLPPEEFRCLALTNVPDSQSVEGHYALATQYSPLDHAEPLGSLLGERRLRFFEAMQAVARTEFIQQVERARQDGGRCLVLEDGGYLAPAINQACLEGTTTSEFVHHATTSAEASSLHPILDPLFIGSVEHTRNGMNRLQAVASDHGTLAFPAFSIAVSRRKTEVEAREVAMTILNAIENVLNATGRTLSRRHGLVLGSRGAIGQHLVRSLQARLLSPASQLSGVDLAVDDNAQPDAPLAAGARTFDELPETVRNAFDLVIGVTGVSVLQGRHLESWLLHGTRRELILASGSTKTEEFADLAAYVGGLLNDTQPCVGDAPASAEVFEVTDPVTNHLYGHRYRIRIEQPDGRRERHVTFLANLTPVNFMFYGVPTEVIDEVLAELLSCALGLVRRSQSESLPKTLQAVDRDITPQGEPMSGKA